MKLKKLVFGFIPLLSLFLAVNIRTSAAVYDTTYSFVEIVTPTEQIYDNGAERILYKGFEIFDKEMTSVLKVAATFDTPPVVKLWKGDYIVITSDPKGRPIRKEISVSAKQNYIINLSR